MKVCVISCCWVVWAAGLPVTAAGATDAGLEDVAAEARAVAAVWETAVKQLPQRAEARQLPAPQVTDVTLARALPGADLRVQMVTWTNRHLFGRAWVDGADETPRSVWITQEKAVAEGVSLSAVIALPGVITAKGGPCEGCVFDLTLTERDGKVSGRFSTAGVEVDLLSGAELGLPSVPRVQGTLTGTRAPLAGATLPSPNLRAPKATGTARDLPAARKVLSGAVGLLRLYRALDIALTQGVTPQEAWNASQPMVPEFPSEDTAAKSKPGAKTPKPLDLDMDVGLDEGGERPAPAKAKPAAGTGITPATAAQLASVRNVLERMKTAAVAWSAALPSLRGYTAGREETAADEDFGPWYGAGCLATNAAGVNLLPGDAAADGNPCWLFVRNWKVVGPFPAGRPGILSANLPEFLDLPHGTYMTDLEALRSLGETNVPVSSFVSWQGVEDQIEEGLQRPWTRREKGGHGSALKYFGPLNGYSYARTEIVSSRDVDLWVGIGADDFGRVWVNDRLAAATVDKQGPAGEDSQESERVAWGRASFRKGTNVLIVRCDKGTDIAGPGGRRRTDPGSATSHFWVKVAVRGKPLEPEAARARQAAIAEKQKNMRHLPPNVVGYRNNNVAFYPDARPVTAWNLDTGANVIWRVHLELESGGGYGSNVDSSKAPPVVMNDPAGGGTGRLIVLGEPHFVYCLDKATGKILWERECNVLEFTAPDKVEESRRLWAEYAKARAALQKLGRDYADREATLMKTGKTKDEAKEEIVRLSKEVSDKKGSGKGRGGAGYYDFLLEHGQFERSGYGFWTGYSYASPVTDGRRVWVKFGTGVAACFDREGNRIWMTRIPAEGRYTVCPSPLLVGGVFVVEVGAASDRPGQERFDWDYTRLIGLDAATGKELWRTEPLFHPTVTSSSVAMRTTNGREEMDVVVTEAGAMVRAEDGKILSRTWLLDAGWGTPTVGGTDLYQVGDPGGLTVSRPVMYDRDSAGLRRLWVAPIPTGFDAGMAFADGLLYGSGGGQGPGGYVVFDTVRRRTLRHENPGHGDRSGVWRGIPPQSNGRQYVPIIGAGDYVFVGEHGSVFHGRVARGCLCGVVQKRWDGLLVGKSQVEKSWTGPPIFDGEHIYVRTDPSIVCLGTTGEEGRKYEADVNASYMLGDLEAQPPEDTPPIEGKPSGGVPYGGGPPFPGYVSYPMEVYGYFDIGRADEVLAALGGPGKIGVDVKDVWNDKTTVEVGGQSISRKYHGNCGIYGHHELGESAHFRDVAFGKGAYFRATVVSDRERVVRVWAPQEPPDVWISGQRVPEGTRVRLKPGTYSLLARAYHTEEWPAAMGFYFRLDDSSDVAAERKQWQERLRTSKPELERIARYATRPAHVARAKKLLAALESAR